MTPDWIPNIHPLIVHFPIALLVVAVLFDVARLFFKNQSWLFNTVIALYSAGTVGLIASFLSGRNAVDTVSISGDAVSVVTTHEDWALYTLIYFSLFTILRLWTWWKNFEVKQWVTIGFITLSFTGIGLLWYTGDLGTQLVYKHGVAVGEIDQLEQRIETLENDLAAFREDASPVINEDGAWIWRIGTGADQALTESFTTIEAQNISAETIREDGRFHLELTSSGESSFFIVDNILSSVEGRVELNASDFNGNFMLVHHYQNPENYQFLKLEESNLIQGRVENGSENIFQSDSIDASSWMTLRVTKDGQHFYGYKDGQTIIHSHADEMEAGKTGFALAGSGVLKIRVIEFASI